MVGLGLSGYWGARLVLERKSPCSLTVCEGAPSPEKERRAEELKRLAEEKGSSFQVAWQMEPRGVGGYQRVVISPGVPHDLPWLNEARERGIEVMGEMELAFREVETPIIAVTGTNGKTTTTALIAHILNANGITAWTGGNIGDPLSHFAVEGRRAEWIVLEVSSFQLETVKTFHPKVAMILNLAEDHLDRYPSMSQYAGAKANILNNLGSDDLVVANADDPAVMEMVQKAKARLATFGAAKGVPTPTIALGEEKVLLEGEELCHLEGLDLQARLNMPNIMAAILATGFVGVEPRRALEAARGFQWQPHRTQVILNARGVTFVDDSKATNPSAVKHALSLLEGPMLLLLGGRNKGFRFNSLRPLIRERVRRVLLFGEAAGEIAQDLEGCEAGISRHDTMEEAVKCAVEEARPGDTVLLSPGCASFDQFKSYAHRGEVFRKLVRRLA